MKRLLRLIGMSAAIAGAGCQTDHALGPVTPTDEGPGPLELRIAGPDSGLGALLVVVGGGPVDSMTSTQLEVAFLSDGSDDHRAMLRGTMVTGAIAYIWVPARERRADYTAVVLQATDRTTYAQRPTDGYRISIRPRGTP